MHLCEVNANILTIIIAIVIGPVFDYHYFYRPIVLYLCRLDHHHLYRCLAFVEVRVLLVVSMCTSFYCVVVYNIL